MEPRHLPYAGHNVPRYTSYPTAPQFGTAIGAAQATTWLAALPATTPLSLYLHVPFCSSMCSYCGCHTKVVARIAPVEAHAETLVTEIRLVSKLLGGRRPVRHIHWGGGTPSMLPADSFARIVDELDRCFDLGPLREHAIEIDPRGMTPGLARQLAADGVNRASLGVQDFAPDVQQAIGRVQPFEVVEAACNALRNAGIDQLNFDLMYGLPLQTATVAEASTKVALRLKPNRIALFGYAHVPWMKKHQRLIDEAVLPGAAARLAQAEAAAAVLTGAGFVPIGLDHFARPDDPLARAQRAGRLRRNFQGYTDDDAGALIGLGPSAISALPQGYLQNLPDLAGHARAVHEGRLATARGLRLTPDDRLRGAIIERLMCDLTVDVGSVCRAHRMDTARLRSSFAALAPLVADGLVQVEGRRVTVPESARPFMRLAASAFDAYLQSEGARYSRAV